MIIENRINRIKITIRLINNNEYKKNIKILIYKRIEKKNYLLFLYNLIKITSIILFKKLLLKIFKFFITLLSNKKLRFYNLL